ncbi:MAG TPA: hypothetical protein ENH40_05690 [Nitrospirae bacterium]|nr:hypothetical protein [Nitrospirota bacterium]
MAKKRIATILSPKDLGAAGTEVIDITLKDVISRITLIWACTNVTVSVMLDTVLACLTKIELVDGSNVLFSLSGKEAQALNFFNRKVMPYNALSLTVGDEFIAEVSIDFGRYLYDTTLAFDPMKFNNPQLKITWDEDACNTSVIVNSLQIYAHIFEGGGVSPTGFLQAKEQFQYAMAASSHEYLDLPIDLTIRQILLRAHSPVHSPVTLLDTIKITEDNDNRVPLNMKANDYFRMMKAYYPRIYEKVTYDAAVTAKTIYATVSEELDININYDGTAFVTAQSLFAVPTYTGSKVALAASVDIGALSGHISGMLPHNCIPIPFGDQNDIKDWLTLEGVGNLRADILSSSDADSADTGYLITEQLRSY